MEEFKLIMNAFLEGENFPSSEFIQWIQTPLSSKQSEHYSPVQLEALKFSQTYLESIKNEFALLLLNFLRDDSLFILRSSQNLNQTPLKKPSLPEKYEYTSPAKTIQTKHKNIKDKDQKSQNGKFNSHQRLFGESRQKTEIPNAETNDNIKLSSKSEGASTLTSLPLNGSLVPEERFEIESLPYEGNQLLSQYPFSSTPNIVKLEKRLGKCSISGEEKDRHLRIEEESTNESFTFSRDISGGSNGNDSIGVPNAAKIEVHRDKRNKATSRRSLDSQINACQNSQQAFSAKGKQKHNSSNNRTRIDSGGRNRSSESHKQGKSSISLADYIPMQSKQQKKKGKSKNRRSDGAVNDQRITEDPEINSVVPKNEVINEHSNTLVCNILENGDAVAEFKTSKATIGENQTQYIEKVNQLAECSNLIENMAPSIPKPDFSRVNELIRRSSSSNGEMLVYEEPEPEKVTCKGQLDKLITVYCYCIQHLLVPNILGEVNHLLHLLTVKDIVSNDLTSKKVKNPSYFNNVHNCVYFAANTLSRLQGNLLFGFQSLQKDLKKIDRMETFCPGTCNQVDVVATTKEDQPFKKKSGSSDILETFSGTLGGDSVQFQVETDGRENFTDSKTFQDFKRQRDQFFNILQEWKGSHPKDFSISKRSDTIKHMNSSMPTNLHGRYSKGMGGRNKFTLKPNSPLEEHWYEQISELLGVQNSINMNHLATLFQKQLLQDSLNDLVNKERPILDVFDCSVQDQLKKDPIKLKKLFNRYAPSSNIDPCPEFPQTQEFYRDFLRFGGGNHCFIEHLKRGLRSSILELNDKVFDISKTENNSAIEADDKNRGENELYISVVKLRILAKFLGYVESLPYKTQNTTSRSDDRILESQIKDRKNFVPFIDLFTVLEDSLRRHRLILTLPWIIEYCAVQDKVTMKLPYFEKVFDLMVQIYKNQLKLENIHSDSETHYLAVKNNTLNDSLALEYADMKNTSSVNQPVLSKINRFNAFFLCINLGWFFEKQYFPRELFIQMKHKEFEVESVPVFNNEKRRQKGDALDYLTELRPSLLNLCCPYISELKVVLYEFCTGFKTEKANTDEACERFTNKRRASTDMIAKINTKDDHSHGELTNEPEPVVDIQNELEIQFLRKQSKPTKDTIKLVAERVASNFARCIEKKIVPQETEAAEKHIKDNLEMLTMINLNTRTRDYLANLEIEKDENKFDKVTEDEIRSQIDDLSAKSYENVKKEAQKLLNADVGLNCAKALKPLLPSDMKPSVITKCVGITSSRAIREGKTYIIRNVTKQFFFEEYSKLDKNLRIPKEKQKAETELVESFDLKSLTISNLQLIEEEKASWALMGKTKQFLLEVMKNRAQYMWNCDVKVHVFLLIENIKTSLKSDISTNVEENVIRAQTPLSFSLKRIPNYGWSDIEKSLQGFESLTFDLAIVICSYRPECFVPEVQDAFINFWKWKTSPFVVGNNTIHLTSTNILTVISPRNLTLLSESQSQIDTWKRLEAFIGRLLKQRLLIPLVLEEQVLSVLKEEWPSDVLKRFASCLQGVVDSWRISSEIG